MNNIRKEIQEHLIEVMIEAEKNGLDGVRAAERAYPGTPSDVLWGAWAELESRKTEAWWKTVENTVDVEIIRAALEKGAGE